MHMQALTSVSHAHMIMLASRRIMLTVHSLSLKEHPYPCVYDGGTLGDRRPGASSRPIGRTQVLCSMDSGFSFST